VKKQYLIRWAGVDLPGDTESHFGVVGINGSGKTLALQTLLRSVIPTIREKDVGATARRALVFDPENKLIPLLYSLAGEENVQILNPFDQRSRPWDLANDIDDLATAQEMASIFVAEQKGDAAPFWQKTARGILSAVLKSLHLQAPGRWTLRQVFHIVTNEARLTAVLAASNQTQGLIELLRPTQTTLFNVLAELRGHMDMLELIAALWDNSVKVHRKKSFTLKDWLEGQSVLVFGRPTQLEDTVLALNRVIVKRASQLIRAPIPKKQSDARGRTWIFLDELRNIGNLPGLDKLLTEGRSRGARVVITFQDIDGLREVYGERIAEEITNQCDTMSYLRCRGTTAKWAADRLGRSEYWDKDFHTGSSATYGESSSRTYSSGSNSRKNLTDAVLESQLSGLPPVARETIDGKLGGFVQGWHVVTALECVYSTGARDAWYPFEDSDGDERFEKRRPEDQILRPWDDNSDWEELGFKPKLPPAPLTLPDIDSLRG
jgi:type IV secretory pathway TraG/TraD family ATPase VirD4